jgi:hypothetical protein
MRSLGHRFRGTLNRAKHPRVREAAAKYAGERLLRLRFGRRGSFIEERFRRHDYGVETEATLSSLFFDESLLKRMWFVRCADSFQRGDFGAGNGLYGSDAGTNCLLVDDDRAGAALSKATAKFGPAKREVIAQGIKQRSGGIEIEAVRLAVNLQFDSRHKAKRIADRFPRQAHRTPETL